MHGRFYRTSNYNGELDGIPLMFYDYHECVNGTWLPNGNAFLWGTAESAYCSAPDRHEHEQPELKDGKFPWAFWKTDAGRERR